MTNPHEKVRPKVWSTPTLQKTSLTDEELIEIRTSADPEAALRDAYIAHQQADTCGDNPELALGTDQERISAVRDGLDRCRKVLDDYRAVLAPGNADGGGSGTG